jgi:sugar/nucleoside kinase (ribokinase family)
MTNTKYDVTGIGNAIVDVLAHATDAFVQDKGLTKGAMTLVDADQAEHLYEAMGPGTEISGGSAGNTMAGIASLGGRGAYVGKVKNDQLGEVFRHDIRAAGLTFDTAAADDGPPTARCLILVTPDAQRTMCTFLGACTELGPDDVHEDLVKASQVTYMEGYLWDPPEAKKAFLKAAEIAHANGRKVSLSLSDGFCVDRHRAEFRELVDHHVDILFANETEILSLYETTDFDAAVQQVRGKCEYVALTRSEKGSVILNGGDAHHVDIERVGKVVDTTGAGDLYAAGFLYGVTHGLSPVDSGKLGALCAAEVISHMGARPDQDLAQLAKSRGLPL